jgi:hypothetical protein
VLRPFFHRARFLKQNPSPDLDPILRLRFTTPAL